MNDYRFVILEHNWNGIHYDLMLEENGVLKTWRVAEMLRPGAQLGEELPNHRVEYLHYEGVVSGNRGEVKRVASGTYRVDESGLGKSVFVLSGTITGRLEIIEQDKTTQLFWTPTN
jgi:hypothetical protein